MRAFRQRHGFTLVELLVVISIIALLVALLLPALSNARKAARIALCGSQLRQHGIAFNAYQVDCKGYYPLFGGQVGDYLGIFTISLGDTGNLPYGTLDFAPSVYNIFGSYLNLPSGNGVTPLTSTAPIKYCPVVDWFHFGSYTFVNPAMTPYSGGEPGYAYYTGRCVFAGASGDPNTYFNTVNRRDDPREILMTDQLMEVGDAGQSGDFTAGYGTIVDYSLARWFNPHVDRSSIPAATGSGHHLASDGHVAALPFRGSRISDPNYDPSSHILIGHYEYALFTGAFAGPSASATDGRYAIVP
jgi:prepilin-type N-terminal cleavage/methylation domain-containing protein